MKISEKIMDEKTEESRENTRKYETLVNNLSVGIYRNTPGPKGHFLEVNPAMILMFDGSTKEEFIKHNVSDLYQDPIKRSLFVKKITKYGFVRNEELDLVTFKGRKIIASVSAVMNKDKDGKVYFDGIIEDITERKKTEEMLKNSYNELEIRVKNRTKQLSEHVVELENVRKAMLNVLEDLNIEKKKTEDSLNDLKKFKLALDNVSDHVTITDKEGIVVYANQAVETITGYSQKETIGKKAGALWKLPMPSEYYQQLWRTIKGQKKTFLSEIQNKRKNGQIYTAMINISPVLDGGGSILFFVGLERDITKEKEIDKAKSEFISLASHQLKTPSTAVKLLTERLLGGKMGVFTKKQNEYLKDIRYSNQRMIDLVNTLLNVSRIELGAFNIQIKKEDASLIMQSILKEIKLIADKKQLKLKIISPEKSILILLDETLFRIVINNIILNAINYTSEKGKVIIEYKIVKKGKIFGGNILEEDCFAIAVSDTGYGIPKEEQGKMFTKLFRGDKIKEKQTDGTGLGLYIVKSILDHSGGSVWFTSRENQGSIFYVIIPMTGMAAKADKNKDFG